MKKIGKIIDYNGSSGFIIDNNGKKYILLSQNIIYDDPKIGDYVLFNVEIFKTIEFQEKIATFVKKVKE